MDTSQRAPVDGRRAGDGRVPIIAHPGDADSTEARILETIHDNVIVRSIDDRIVFWNRAAENTYGWPRSEALGRTTHDLLRTKFPVSLEGILAELRRTGRWEGELVHARKDGGSIVVASRWVLERDADGNPMRVLEVNNDITERKLAEAALALRERQQAIIAHFGQEALRRIPIAALMQKATRALSDGLGVTYSKVLLQPTGSDDLMVVAGVGWKPGIVGEARVPASATSQAGFTMATRRPVIITDHRRERRFTLPPFLQEHGIVSGMSVAIEVGGEAVGTITAESDKERAFTADDVSFISAVATVLSSAMERDRAEATVHERNAELAETVARLEAVSLKLEGSNADLAQFAYVASHDLQEPLRMVASYVQLLSRRYHGKLDSDADDFIRFASEGAARMQRLINDLLEFSRVESRGAELKPTVVADVLARAQANLAVAIAEAGAKINIGATPSVLADEGQLTQLFQNLIGNAIKFRRDVPPEVTVTATRQGREWIFSVADNGIGIDPSHHDRIFVIFQRLHSRVKYDGTGIGLAICKKIVERHRGRIWVESVAGEGSTFRFTMPALEATP